MAATDPGTPLANSSTIRLRSQWWKWGVGLVLLPAAIAVVAWLNTDAAPSSPPANAATNAHAGHLAPIQFETETIKRRAVARELRAVGKLDYSERQVAFIAARIAGRVDRVYADFTGVTVNRGDHLLEIYSPDLITAQRELIVALEGFERDKPRLQPGEKSLYEAGLDAARTKLRLWGLTAEQVQALEATRTMQTHTTVVAPLSGIVTEKMVREGQYVNQGDALYHIANFDPIWLYLNIYEFDMAAVRLGQAVEVVVEAYPGEVFRGTVTFVDPILDDATRTIRVRVNLKNADGRLKPQMYATAKVSVGLRSDGTPQPTGLEGKFICPMHPEIISDKAGHCSICGMPLIQVRADSATGGTREFALVIPATAVLDTGRRRIAYRRTAEGSFELRELKLGPRCDGKDDHGGVGSYFVVLAGLSDGDAVVVRGGFMLDSQRQIDGMPSLLFPDGASGLNLHSGHAMPANTNSNSGGGHAGHQH